MSTWALALGALVVLVYAAASAQLTAWNVSAAMFFVTAGFVLGTDGLGWIGLSTTGADVRLLAEVTLALVLFSDASRIDLKVLSREYAAPLRLLAIGLPLTIGIGTVAAIGLVPGLTTAEALVLAVVLAPTDAALGAAVVTDARLPSRVRQGLNVESGLNDGLCVPLVAIAIAIAATEEGVISSSGAATLLVEEIGFGVVAGCIAGLAGAVLVRIGRAYSLIAPTWLQAVSLGSAALAYGIALPLEGSGFIAAFVGGLVFGTVCPREREVTMFLEEAGGLLTGLTLLVFGAVLLGPQLANVTWEIALYAVLSLTVIRMLPVTISLLGSGAQRQSIGFLAWFGPRGLASLVFAFLLVEEADLTGIDTILATASLTILLSIFAHGISAGPLTRYYVRWWQAHPDYLRLPMEGAEVPSQRWRARSLVGGDPDSR
jgi:NhaP-type Na+/H+ or K+/H+ antiporter